MEIILTCVPLLNFLRLASTRNAAGVTSSVLHTSYADCAVVRRGSDLASHLTHCAQAALLE
jgi:hypothetical protein